MEKGSRQLSIGQTEKQSQDGGVLYGWGLRQDVLVFVNLAVRSPKEYQKQEHHLNPEGGA